MSNNREIFSRIVSNTQSKYKVVSKNSKQQNSYNLDIETEGFFIANNVIKKTEEQKNGQDTQYELSDDVKLVLGPGVMSTIGEEYLDIEPKMILVHTASNNKFQIKRTDHKIEDINYTWFVDFYDNTLENTIIKIYYDEDKKVLTFDSIFSAKSIPSIGKTPLEQFKEYYLARIEETENDDYYNHIIELRKEFEHEYPINELKQLTLSDYSLGNDDNSLCYKLEFGKYKEVGPTIRGLNSEKYGIYKNRDSDVYKSKYLDLRNLDDSFTALITDLSNYLINLKDTNDSICSYEVYPNLKGMEFLIVKLAYLYYPTRFVNIVAKNKLINIFNLFEYQYTETLNSESLSYMLNEKIRNDIPEINNYDPEYLGAFLLEFINKMSENFEEDDRNVGDIQGSLDDIFLDAEEIERIIRLINNKRNVIFEGAPGVGKTYMAKKIIQFMAGGYDSDHIMSVQFHQSYSYEDFVEGIRPNADGKFNIVDGKFKQFCQKAEKDEQNNYYCIIDEINRGNLSRIFGELLMLIEKDKRGQKVMLPYSHQEFSVPKNIIIIGMMNTADRSLALIDYALRRRFSFYRVNPAFNNTKFMDYVNSCSSDRLSLLIEEIKELNKQIENDISLGEGFVIGHSYFCDFDKNENIDEQLALIIEYDIIPLIQEYWFDDKTNAINWINKLKGIVNG